MGDILDYAYKPSLNIMGWVPARAPNPRCCSEVTDLCPRCAARALAEAGFMANSGDSTFNTFTGLETTMQDVDRNDILPLPTIDWADVVRQRQPVANANVRDLPPIVRRAIVANGDGLVMPEIDWSANQRHTSAGAESVGEDAPLTMPKIDWAEVARENSRR